MDERYLLSIRDMAYRMLPALYPRTLILPDLRVNPLEVLILFSPHVGIDPRWKLSQEQVLVVPSYAMKVWKGTQEVETLGWEGAATETVTCKEHEIRRFLSQRFGDGLEGEEISMDIGENGDLKWH